MAVGSRFALLNDEQVKEFSEGFDNENTKKKTLYDLKVFKEFLDTCDEKREIEDIAPVELQEIIKKFVLAMRKKNGEEYEPSSIRAFIQSIDRHLRKNNYGFSVLSDKEFHEVQDILKKKQKQLKSVGKGNRPNAADPLSDEDIGHFLQPWSSRNSLSLSSIKYPLDEQLYILWYEARERAERPLLGRFAVKNRFGGKTLHRVQQRKTNKNAYR